MSEKNSPAQLEMEMYGNSRIVKALDEIRNGKMFLLYDSAKREGETDFVIPANNVSFRDVMLMRKYAGGLMCTAIEHEAARKMGLRFMAEILNDAAKSNIDVNDELAHTVEKTGDLKYDSKSSFSIWVNHRDTRTGIPDDERALTIRKLGEMTEKIMDGEEIHFSEEFRTPGHTATLIAAKGLLDERQGQTELSIALAKMAGVTPAMVVCEMLDDNNGKALSKEDAIKYGEEHDMVFLEGKDVVEAYSIFMKNL